MANIAIFASGNGSNFEALVKEFKNDKRDCVKLLIYDRRDAYVVKRAEKYNIPMNYINYFKLGKDKAEESITESLVKNSIDIVFLAGFMRVLSKSFIEKNRMPIVNIHPSLLPKYKGENGIGQAFDSDDKETGITIHYVNEEVDGGEIILQKSIEVVREKGIEYLENEIHKLEHEWYPKTARMLVSKL